VKKVDYKTMSADEIAAHKQQWADYIRARRMPEKACTKCKTSYPNDRLHFAVGPTGALRSTCHSCAGGGRGVGKRTGRCPLCSRIGNLVMDHNAPMDPMTPMLVCQRCLTAVNFISECRPGVLANIEVYIKWRAGVLDQHAQVPADEPGEPADPVPVISDTDAIVINPEK